MHKIDFTHTQVHHSNMFYFPKVYINYEWAFITKTTKIDKTEKIETLFLLANPIFLVKLHIFS